MLSKGKLITIEGLDCAGKTSQIKVLKETLENLGYTVITGREPGGTGIGELIREILLHKAEMDRTTELLLFTASRIQNIKQVILPAISEGKVVILDRFIDSTYAYQGYGRGCMEDVMRLESMVTSLIVPDYTLYLSISLETAQQRMHTRQGQVKDRFDDSDLKFKQRILDGYNNRAETDSERIMTISAEGSLASVSEMIQFWANEVFHAEQNLTKSL